MIAGLPAGAGRELRFIKNDLKVPYSDQFSLGVRGRFQPGGSEVGYSYVDSQDGFAYLLGNRRPDGSFFPPTGRPDSPFGFAPSPFGSDHHRRQRDRDEGGHGLFEADEALYRGSPWSLDATYTFTEAEENRQLGEVFSLDFPSIDDYPFTATGVRKHRFVMAATVDIPLEITLAGKFQIASPKYLAQQIDSIGTRPAGPLSRPVEGNGDLWGYRQMDLSPTKYVPITFVSDETRLGSASTSSTCSTTGTTAASMR